MILIRETTPADIERATVATGVNTPSIRNKTCMSPDSGSQ